MKPFVTPNSLTMDEKTRNDISVQLPVIFPQIIASVLDGHGPCEFIIGHKRFKGYLYHIALKDRNTCLLAHGGGESSKIFFAGIDKIYRESDDRSLRIVKKDKAVIEISTNKPIATTFLRQLSQNVEIYPKVSPEKKKALDISEDEDCLRTLRKPTRLAPNPPSRSASFSTSRYTSNPTTSNDEHSRIPPPRISSMLGKAEKENRSVPRMSRDQNGNTERHFRRRVFYKEDLIEENFVSKGGQAYVAVAMCKALNKQVAVKYSTHIARLKGDCTKEMNLLKNLAHPHIVKYYGVLYESVSSRQEQALGFVMEYMEGGSLHGVIYERYNTPYDGYIVLEWIKQVASGLQFLHSRGVIHRDIKPANLLLDKMLKNLKICDLGISTQTPSTETEVGTIYYTAPEILKRIHRTSYNNKCDIYSLGITFWEICHRKNPYKKAPLLDLMTAIRDNNLRPKIDDEVCHKDFSDLIKSMWNADPEIRPTASQILEEMKRIENKYSLKRT